MSIGTRILFVVAILAASLSALLALKAHSAWSDTAKAMQQQALSAASAHLISASAALAVERGLVNGQLANPTPMPQDVRARIDAGRKAEQAALEAANLTAADAEFLKPSQQALAQMRVGFDEASAGRSQPPLASWFQTASSAIDAIVDLRRRIDSRGSAQTETHLLVTLRDRVAELAEFAGRERGTLNGLIAAGAKASPAQIYALGALSGRVESAWAVIGPASATSPLAVKQAVEQARRAWEQDFAPLRRSVMQAAANRDTWPVEASTWFSSATKAIDSMLAAQKICSSEIERGLLAEQSRLNIVLIGSSLALLSALALSAGISLYVRRSVLRPLTRMIAILSDLAGGKLDIVIPMASGRHEIARLTAATIRFQETASQARSMAQAQVELRQAAETSRRDALRDIGNMIGDVSDVAVSGVVALTAHLQKVAAKMYDEAGTMAQDSQQVEQDAGLARQSSAVASDQARELTSAIGEIAQQMERAAGCTREAVGRTRETEIVFATLSANVKEVSEVARLIAEIAGRTNLLALNATIEAARAGEAGRGFAVVAGEVKILAQETERSTGRIAQRVAAIEASTRAAILAVEAISTAITEIDGVASMVAAAVEQQAASTAGIAEAVGQISLAADRVSDRMHAMTNNTQECEAGAGRLSSISNDVNSQITGVKGILVGIMCERVAALDRRGERRTTMQVKASLEAQGKAVAGVVADISVIGARFVAEGPARLTEGDRVQVHLPQFSAFEARVVQTENRLVRLEFHEASDTSRSQLQAWIDRNTPAAHAA